MWGQWYDSEEYNAPWAFDMQVDHWEETGCWAEWIDQWNGWVFTTYSCGTCGMDLE